MISPSIFYWFGPPPLSSPDLRRRARALWIISWPFFAVVTVGLALAVLVDPHTLERRAVTVASVAILTVLLHAISRSGRPTLASWSLVLGLTAIVTERAWITGGIHAPVEVFYALFILAAGMVIGVRGSLVTAAVSFGGACVLTLGTARGWLTPRPGAGSPYEAFVFVVLVIGLALVVQALMAFQLRSHASGDDAMQTLVHDMRTPMQIVIGHLELLRENAGDIKDVEAALDGASTLQRLTNSVVDIGRLEAGRMPIRLSVANLSVLAHPIVMAVRAIQPGRDIALEALGSSTCTCDPDLTRRIIENLVSHAISHTPSDGRVRVITSSSHGRASIAVRGGAAGFGSAGVGLAFCKLAVEAQGGTVRVEEGAPDGSVFVVELPR